VIAEAIYLAVACLIFVVLYATRSAWRKSWTGRNVMALMAGFMALVIGLVLQAKGLAVPIWVWAVVVAELCYAVTERVWLLWEAQRKERV
jgi:hypothetical protein